MTCDFHRLGASISPGKEKPCREAQRHGIVTFGFDPLVNLPVFSICTKCLDGSELGIFYTEGEAPQWDFRHRLENGIRSQKKLPLPLLFENLKVVGVGGRTTQVLLSVSSLVWGRINNGVRVNRVCSPDLPD